MRGLLYNGQTGPNRRPTSSLCSSQPSTTTTTVTAATKPTMRNPLKLKLEPIGAAIRLVTIDGSDTPSSPRFDDDAFLEPESPWQSHSFLHRLKRNSTSASRKKSVSTVTYSRRQSTQSTTVGSECADNKVHQPPAGSALDRNRPGRMSAATITESTTPTESTMMGSDVRPKFNAKYTTADDSESPLNSASTVDTFDVPPSIRLQAAEERMFRDGAIDRPLSPTDDAGFDPLDTSFLTPSAPPLTASPAKGGSSDSISRQKSLHRSTASLSTVSSQTPSVSSSILFPPGLDSSSQGSSSVEASPTFVSSPTLSDGGFLGAISSPLPTPPAAALPTLSKVERLRHEIDQANREANVIHREMDLLDRILEDPYSYPREQRERTRLQRDDSSRQLDAVEKRKYELGMKLTRAWNRERDNHGHSSTRFFSGAL